MFMNKSWLTILTDKNAAHALCGIRLNKAVARPSARATIAIVYLVNTINVYCLVTASYIVGQV